MLCFQNDLLAIKNENLIVSKELEKFKEKNIEYEICNDKLILYKEEVCFGKLFFTNFIF